MESRGHVFVVHGDLLRIAADAVLIPCDRGFDVRPHWKRFQPGPGKPVSRQDLSWDPAHPRVTPPYAVGDQVCRYVDSGATPATAKVDWLREGLRQGLGALAADVEGRPALHGRDRPLIALPLAGTGAGGFADVRGDALIGLIGEARDRAGSTAVDVVIVCPTRADYTAVQSRRTDEDWPDLTASEHQHACDLAEALTRGDLMLFLGAGVSRGAGLPDFAELLDQLAGDVHGRSLASVAGKVSLPARAEAIVHVLGEATVRQRLTDALCRDWHGVSHALLASLRAPEAVTTNFDNLYELAAAVPFEQRLQVVPWERRPGRHPWLLKAHGDAELGDLVLTAAQYERYQDEHGPTASVIQSLFLLGRHVLFIGYSLRDSNIRGLMDEVARLLSTREAEYQRFGTVLSIDAGHRDDAATDGRLPTISFATDPASTVPATARRLEMFLDRVAWQAARGEASWLLDPTYRALLPVGTHSLVDQLIDLDVPVTDQWSILRDALSRLGRRM